MLMHNMYLNLRCMYICDLRGYLFFLLSLVSGCICLCRGVCVCLFVCMCVCSKEIASFQVSQVNKIIIPVNMYF